MSLKDKQAELDQFTGTEGYIRWSPLFRRMVLTDGAKFVADNGGAHGAYWLVDASVPVFLRLKQPSKPVPSPPVRPDGRTKSTFRP